MAIAGSYALLFTVHCADEKNRIAISHVNLSLSSFVGSENMYTYLGTKVVLVMLSVNDNENKFNRYVGNTFKAKYANCFSW